MFWTGIKKIKVEQNRDLIIDRARILLWAIFLVITSTRASGDGENGLKYQMVNTFIPNPLILPPLNCSSPP